MFYFVNFAKFCPDPECIFPDSQHLATHISGRSWLVSDLLGWFAGCHHGGGMRRVRQGGGSPESRKWGTSSPLNILFSYAWQFSSKYLGYLHVRLILFSLQAIYQKALQIIENFFPDGDQVSSFFLFYQLVGGTHFWGENWKCRFFVDLSEFKVRVSFREFQNSSFCLRILELETLILRS
jgi:hypothetical protein